MAGSRARCKVSTGRREEIVVNQAHFDRALACPLIGLLAIFLCGCDPDLPSVVTTSAEASAIAVEQCGNEFHLGQPTAVSGGGDEWSVSWSSGYTAQIESTGGAVLSCLPKTSD